ncbi:MAG: hypothetical protein QOE70_2987 [Chthoniobacter sp.]|nr:hypothetical protein [Chthoniobacter sp.]
MIAGPPFWPPQRLAAKIPALQQWTCIRGHFQPGLERRRCDACQHRELGEASGRVGVPPAGSGVSPGRTSWRGIGAMSRAQPDPEDPAGETPTQPGACLTQAELPRDACVPRVLAHGPASACPGRRRLGPTLETSGIQLPPAPGFFDQNASRLRWKRMQLAASIASSAPDLEWVSSRSLAVVRRHPRQPSTL